MRSGKDLDENPQIKKVDKRLDNPPPTPGKPRITKEEIEDLLQSNAKFQQYFQNKIILNTILRQFHQMHEDQLCIGIIRHLTHDEGLFQKLIPDMQELQCIAEDISPELAREIVEFALTHLNEFERLVRSDYDVQVLNKLFSSVPEFAGLFSSCKREQAIENVRVYASTHPAK